MNEDLGYRCISGVLCRNMLLFSKSEAIDFL
jgi:hypothetical protein